METVHVVLPVHGRREITRRFVECLRKQTYPAVRLLVVDDGSTDGTAEAVIEMYPSAEVIRGNGTLWWAGSLQRALDRLRDQHLPDADIVLLANDDTTFECDFVEQAVRYLEGKCGYMLLARMKDAATGVVEESGLSADLRTLRFEVAASPASINCLSTRGLFIRWRDVKTIGGFSPRLLPHYLSDYEYTLRGFRKGLRGGTVGTVWLNANGSTTGIRNLDALVGWDCVRTLFSIKCAVNPVYTTTFVVLAVPARWIVPNVLRIWWRALKLILRQGLLRRGAGGYR